MRAGLHVGPDAREKLSRLVGLLRSWSKAVNLVSAPDLEVVWRRHVADSLQLLWYIDPAVDRAIDLGSGAGFPGLVLAMATPIHFELVEADQRRAAFLSEAARICKVNVTIHAARVEDVITNPAPLITSRAFAPLPRLLRVAEPLLARGGCCLFLKGGDLAGEMDDARRLWRMQTQRVPSSTAEAGVILRVSALRPIGAG